MTDGLAILAAWAEFLVLLTLLAYFVVRRTSSDALGQSRPEESDRSKSGEE